MNAIIPMTAISSAIQNGDWIKAEYAQITTKNVDARGMVNIYFSDLNIFLGKGLINFLLPMS